MQKAQSAMEYLMTYGWAILIIAIVLSALFQLGVFSGNSFSTKAPPGSCKVARVGTGITQTTSLAGECQGILPEYVAQEYAIDNGFLVTPAPPLNYYPGGISISSWVYIFVTTPGFTNVLYDEVASSSMATEIGLYFSPSGFKWITNTGSNSMTALSTVSDGHWYAVCGIYNTSTSTASIYLNGALDSSSGSLSFNTVQNGQIYTLDDPSGSNDMVGYAANLQIYNTSLSASEAQAYYLRGVGGAPARLQNLVGWYPLNGDIKDYSGYNNNGAFPPGATMSFSTYWSSVYGGPT